MEKKRNFNKFLREKMKTVRFCKKVDGYVPKDTCKCWMPGEECKNRNKPEKLSKILKENE